MWINTDNSAEPALNQIAVEVYYDGSNWYTGNLGAQRLHAHPKSAISATSMRATNPLAVYFIALNEQLATAWWGGMRLASHEFP